MPEQPTQPTGHTGLRRAIRASLSRRQAVSAVLLGVFGFAAVVAVQERRSDTTYAGVAQQDLIQIINSQSLATTRIEGEMADLTDALDALVRDTEQGRVAIEEAEAEALALGVLAGTQPAVGPGIVVRVESPPAGVGAEELLTGVQELLDAGAEAIELDGVRFAVRSWIADGPDGRILVDGQPVTAPYVFRAIGTPTALEKGVFFRQGFAADVEDAGGSVEVTQRKRVEIRSVRPLPPVEEASPAPTQ